MDCSQLGAGYVVDEQWTNVDFTVDSCTATGASVTWKVTNQMVGTRVFVNGWSATDGAAATMTATVDIAKTSVTGSVAANPRTTPAPVAPGTVLGIWDGKQVSLSSESGAGLVNPIGPGTVVKHDARTDRLRVYIDADNRITAARCE